MATIKITRDGLVPETTDAEPGETIRFELDGVNPTKVGWGGSPEQPLFPEGTPNPLDVPVEGSSATVSTTAWGDYDIGSDVDPSHVQIPIRGHIKVGTGQTE